MVATVAFRAQNVRACVYKMSGHHAVDIESDDDAVIERTSRPRSRRPSRQGGSTSPKKFAFDDLRRKAPTKRSAFARIFTATRTRRRVRIRPFILCENLSLGLQRLLELYFLHFGSLESR
jgi:hypothetical protein